MTRTQRLDGLNDRLQLGLPVGLTLAALLLAAGPARAACSLASPVVSWSSGASGLWGQGSNWTGGAYPNSASTDVCIIQPVGVTLNVDATVKNLQTDKSATLTIGSGSKLTVAGTQIISSGGLNITGGAQNAVLAISNNVTLSGHVLSSGVLPTTVTLSSGGVGSAVIDGAGHTLTNYDGVIQGAGVIGDDGMNFSNGVVGNLNSSGELLANAPGGLLEVGSGGGSFTNAFIVNVSAGSTLEVIGAAKGLDQVGGVTEVYGELIVPNGFNNEATAFGRVNGQGELIGTGAIVGNVFNDGIIEAGSYYQNSNAYKLTITGNLKLGSGSDFVVNVVGGDPFHSTFYDVGGTATLDGLLDVGIQGVNAGTAIRVMDFSSSTGDFTSVDYAGGSCTLAKTDLWSCGSGYYLEEKFVRGGLDLVPTGLPEPSTWALAILGFTAVGAALRRRRVAAAA